MLNCIALDDEPIALEIIKAHCSQIPFINLIHTFTQASKADHYLCQFPVDLIFLDIQMQDVNGINFYKNIKQEIMVVFTTAFSEYAVDGFQVNAVDYLLKPIKFNRFQAACEKANEYGEFLKSKHSKQQNTLSVRSEYALVKIAFSDILYLETMGDYIKIHCINRAPVSTIMSMKKMLGKLPKEEFKRVHRSFTVNQQAITSVRGKTIIIKDVVIPIGKTYEEDFLRNWE